MILRQTWWENCLRVGVGWKGQVGLVIGKGMKDNGKDVIVKAISISYSLIYIST
jgi:hypothetical protein